MADDSRNLEVAALGCLAIGLRQLAEALRGGLGLQGPSIEAAVESFSAIEVACGFTKVGRRDECDEPSTTSTRAATDAEAD